MYMTKYTLNTINKIANGQFICHIPENTIQLIHSLTTQISSSTYIKIPISNKRNSISVKPKIRNNHKKKVSTEIFTDDDWDTIRSFEVTKLNENEHDQIRSNLNMITEQNYIEKTSIIKELLQKTFSVKNTENIEQISSMVCDIASENRFYSSLYANLYTELCKDYPIMKDILFSRIEIYKNHFQNIQIVNVNDYEQLCKLNKENEKIKAFSSFMVNLTKTGVIQKEIIHDIVYTLFTSFLQLILIENNKTIIDEMVENISILYNKIEFDGYRITTSFGDLSYHALIQEISNLKISKYPSLTNKSIFKFMDILEL